MRQPLAKAVALPSEGLALFRKALGALCLVDALQRATQASLLYSDKGVLPRSFVYALSDNDYSWSLFLLSGQPFFVTGLLVLTALLAALQLLGRDRRGTRVALWVLVFSVQSRHPGVCDSADDLLRLLLFWDMWLPDRPAPGRDLLGLATLGLQVQLSVTVLAAGLSLGPERWLLAAQWGEAIDAAALPWLGRAWLVVLPAIWWRGARPLLAPLAAAALLAQAFLMHPSFPLTLLAGLMSLFSWRYRAQDPVVLGILAEPRRHKPALALGILVCLAGPVWMLASQGQARAPLRVLGLHQNWDRVYPLADEYRAEFILRASGHPKPLTNFGKDQGRRLRLLSHTLLGDRRYVRPLAVSFAEGADLKAPLNVWVKVDNIGADMTWNDPEIWQMDSVVSRPGQKREVDPL